MLEHKAQFLIIVSAANLWAHIYSCMYFVVKRNAPTIFFILNNEIYIPFER